MIGGKDVYLVLSALVPLYGAMVLGYASVRWWKIFAPDQCSGINRFVAVFATPFLSFHFICSNNPYEMSYRFIAADSLQKVATLVVLFIWQAISKRGSLDWTITLFSLTTLPNTLVMGIPLLEAMYGKFTASLMIQIVVLQSVVWYTLMLFLFEYRGAKRLIADQFPGTAGSISSFKVDSDVVSLSGRDPLQVDAEIDDDGSLHVVLKRSTSSSPSIFSSYDKSFDGLNPIISAPPRASNLSGAEVFSLPSFREQLSPRAGLSSSQKNFQAFMTNSFSDIHSLQSSSSVPNFEEDIINIRKKHGRISPYTPLNSMASSSIINGAPQKESGMELPHKELHMFVWSSSVNSSTSKRYLGPEINGRSTYPPDSKVIDSTLQHEIATPTVLEKIDGHGTKKQQMPPTSVITRLILIMVWRKLIRNPNTYASVLGLVWSFISFRWHIEMPLIVSGSVSIISNTGLGMAMFSIGLFAALQPKIIACGKSMALISMAIRFLIGPAIMAATSLAIGLRGNLLRVAIVQAALPLGIVPFIFAKEYDVHAQILSTAVIFGIIVALPVTILYYVLLGL